MRVCQFRHIRTSVQQAGNSIFSNRDRGVNSWPCRRSWRTAEHYTK